MKKYNEVTKKFDIDYSEEHPQQAVIDKLQQAKVPLLIINRELVVEDKDVLKADTEASKV